MAKLECTWLQACCLLLMAFQTIPANAGPLITGMTAFQWETVSVAMLEVAPEEFRQCYEPCLQFGPANPTESPEAREARVEQVSVSLARLYGTTPDAEVGRAVVVTNIAACYNDCQGILSQEERDLVKLASYSKIPEIRQAAAGWVAKDPSGDRADKLEKMLDMLQQMRTRPRQR